MTFCYIEMANNLVGRPIWEAEGWRCGVGVCVTVTRSGNVKYAIHVFFYKKKGARCSSVIERSLLVRWVIGSILHGGPIELFLVPASALRLV